MNAHKIGTVAMVTALNRQTPYRAHYDGGTWRDLESGAFCVDTPTSIRPLVVLDLDESSKDRVGRGEFTKLGAMLREAADEFFIEEAAALAREVADQIEAQTKPPRIPEPGPWGVVEAWKPGIPTRRWVHHEEDRWVSDLGHIAGWDELDAPTLVRAGIGDES